MNLSKAAGWAGKGSNMAMGALKWGGSRALVGGALGAGAAASWNAMDDGNNMSMGKAAMIGAGAMVGMSGLRKFSKYATAKAASGKPLTMKSIWGDFKKSGIYKDARKSFRKYGIKNWANRMDKNSPTPGMGARAFSNKITNALNESGQLSTAIKFNKFSNKLIDAYARPGVSRFGQGFGHGIIGGSILGAGYGMFSDQESMMSGAMKGALAGGIAMGAYRSAGLSYTRPFRRIKHA